MSENVIPEAYMSPDEKNALGAKLAEATLVQIMGDVVATTQKWIDLSFAVQNGEITDVKELEQKWSEFYVLTVMLSAEILQSKYGDAVAEEANRNTTLRTAPFGL